MVNIEYNQTVCSFKYGVKNPKYVYIMLLIILMFIFLITLSLLIVFIMDDGRPVSDIASMTFACVVFGGLSIAVIFMLLYEQIYVKKGILKCITAADACLFTAVPFEFSSAYGGILKKVYKLGVKFNYAGETITMTCKKYAYIKKYIGTEVKAVYSPSCNDIVLIKNN